MTTMSRPAKCNLTAFPIGSWAFSPIHGESVPIVDVEPIWNHTDDAMLTSIGGSDGFGPTKQSICTQMADRFQQWMAGRPGTDLKLPRCRKRAIAREVLEEWVAFLRNCGGLKTYL